MITIKQKENENRKDYLVRVAIAFIEEHDDYLGVDYTMKYDDTECDSYCLIEDLRDEFDLHDLD